MTAEVSGGSALCKTKRVEVADVNEDGSIQNPTIQEEAKELSEKYGKKSIREPSPDCPMFSAYHQLCSVISLRVIHIVLLINHQLFLQLLNILLRQHL